MNRLLLAAGLVVLAASPAPAKRIAVPPGAVPRALNADITVVGKVTAIETDPVEAAPYAAPPEKVAYRVAVIKVEKSLSGADSLTHVKVGFVPPPAAGATPPVRGGVRAVTFTVGEEGLFFLSKHPSGAFYEANWMAPPVAATAEDYKTQLAAVTKATAALADPMKALKAEKAEDRAFAAAVLVTKYRTGRRDGGEQGVEKVPAAESHAILTALAEGDWAKATDAPSPVTAFYALGLGAAQGWTPPKPPAPRAGVSPNADLQKAFAAWVDGPGKDYQIEKLVSKGN